MQGNGAPDINEIKGLTAKQAEVLLRSEGFNEIPSQKRQNIFTIFFKVVKEPMLLLLLGSGFVYLLLGEPRDALMLLSFVLVVVGITFNQERKTERALEALRDLSSPRALVIRDGQQMRIAGREVVRSDTLVLQEGDRVPADAKIISCSNLSVDESLLTGESMPVRKASTTHITVASRPGGDDLPFIYSGTLVVSGHGVAEVSSIGMNTEMGKIGKALGSIREETTPLQKETKKLVRNFAVFGLGLCLVVVAVYGLIHGEWLKGFLAGLTLSMAMLPEEFSVVLIIFFTLGAWRISKMKVLTRKMSAIETLGAATVLCVDKTGTLTENRLEPQKICAEGKFFDVAGEASLLPEKFHELVEFGILASQKNPFDPIDKAIKKLGDRYLRQTEHLHENWKLAHEYPLSKKLLALSHVWESPDQENYVIAAKGAPEAIAELCHLSPRQTEEMLLDTRKLAEEGLRILGVAKASFKKRELPSGQHDFEFHFLGQIGMNDPVRATVPEAVKECYKAGIRVIMITGDYPETASQIAKKIGLLHPDQIVTGPSLEKMSPEELREKVKTVNIFSRMVPEQKLILVNALKANGEVVAMTGDGVNDAPALKAAHIGLAMGQRGTDVAREAASLVLLDDNFSSIVAAVKLGRRIYDNLKKAMAYIMAVHVPIAGMSLLPVLLNLPIFLFPAHIAFLELIIDPACSTVFEAEPEEKDVMDRPPRKLNDSLFDKRLALSLLQGLGVMAMVFAIYMFGLYKGWGETEARTLAFTTLVGGNLALIMTNRSWKNHILATLSAKNQALWWVIGGALAALVAILYIPFFRSLFYFNMPNPLNIALTLLAGLVSILWFEGFKIIALKKS